MQQENFFMIMLTTIFLNILIGAAGKVYIYDEFHQMNLWQAALYYDNFILLFYTIIMVWRGTNFKELFSKCNVAMMTIFMIFDIIVCVADFMALHQQIKNGKILSD